MKDRRVKVLAESLFDLFDTDAEFYWDELPKNRRTWWKRAAAGLLAMVDSVAGYEYNVLISREGVEDRYLRPEWYSLKEAVEDFEGLVEYPFTQKTYTVVKRAVAGPVSPLMDGDWE